MAHRTGPLVRDGRACEHFVEILLRLANLPGASLLQRCEHLGGASLRGYPYFGRPGPSIGWLTSSSGASVLSTVSASDWRHSNCNGRCRGHCHRKAPPDRVDRWLASVKLEPLARINRSVFEGTLR